MWLGRAGANYAGGAGRGALQSSQERLKHFSQFCFTIPPARSMLAARRHDIQSVFPASFCWTVKQDRAVPFHNLIIGSMGVARADSDTAIFDDAG
jgi:hypothetical protein